jgi:catechol 2,3-dioxygenase-like lactoylglutathione lyase family enzyme
VGENSIFFDHVHLISQDARAAAAWYVEKLGGKIVADTEARGATQIGVAFEGATLLIRGRRPGEAPGGKTGQQWGMDHFGFNVRGDFDLFCDHLRRQGVVFTLEPVDYSPNLRIAFILAPDGVSIELLQRKA